MIKLEIMNKFVQKFVMQIILYVWINALLYLIKTLLVLDLLKLLVS